MTWSEIKKAAEQAGIEETDEIYVIKCERRDGDKVLHKSKSGNMIQLAEHDAENKTEVHGCAT